MGYGEGLEDVAEVAELDEAVIGEAPVGQGRAERGEGREVAGVGVVARVGGQEGGDEHVRGGLRDGAHLRVEGLSGVDVAFHKARCGVGCADILVLDALADLRDVFQEAVEGVAVVVVGSIAATAQGRSQGDVSLGVCAGERRGHVFIHELHLLVAALGAV